MKKRFLSMIVIICMLWIFSNSFLFNSQSAIVDINNPSVFLKQPIGSVTCTLYANLMMFRRGALINNNANWDSFTESNYKSKWWGSGMTWTPTGEGMRGNTYVSDSPYNIKSIFGNITERKSFFINYLANHKEGVVIYASYSSSNQHAILLTDYDSRKDIFYCADPSPVVASGRIPLADSSLPEKVQKYANENSITKPDDCSVQDFVLAYVTQIWTIDSGIDYSQIDVEGVYITPGTYNIVSALNNEKSAIDISAQSKDNKANLHLWERHTGDSQKFRIEKSGDYYEIINVNSGKALDVDGASNKNGTNVFQYNIQHSNNQQWSFEDAGNGYYYIKSRVGAYLDVSGGNSGNGTNIQVYQGNKTASQKFKLYSVSDSSGNNPGNSIVSPDVTCNYTGTVNTGSDTLRIRSGPGTSYTHLGDLQPNTKVTIKGENNSGTWGYVTYNGITGWVSLSYIKKEEVHTHSYTGSYYESAHPHKEYQLCTCGEKRYTGNTRKDESCKICNPVVYTVYYNANGGSGAPAPQTHGENENVRLSSQTPTRDGYIFKGWAGSENGAVEMMPGDLCGYNYNVTLYAVWEKEQPKTVTLAFNAGGGIEPPSPRTVNAGTLVNIPGETPNRTGYRFMGWTDAAGSTTVKYEIGDVIRVSSDITLYAVWSSRTQLTLTIGNNWATVNGNQVYNDVAPLIVNDRTMLPARFVAENLGAKVEWVDRTQCVNITGSDNTYIQIFIGSATAYVDGEARYLDSPAFIRNDRTYTPVRFICEALGAEVGWNEALEQVNIIK